jgi:hypothetical protein
MFNDKAERRSYRKSPGRQYGYEYNPLHEQRRTDTPTRNETWSSDNSHKPTGTLAPRPDPRRTRQLMRQNILASKSRSAVLDPAQEDSSLDLYEAEEAPSSETYSHAGTGSRHRNHRPSLRNYTPEHYREFEEEQIAQDWIRHGESLPDYMDPDIGFEEEDPLEERVRQVAPRPPVRRRTTHVLDEEEEDELLEAELEEKERKASRRKFLIGAAVVGGAAVAAYEIGTHVPNAIGNGIGNIDHQLQQAFNDGVAKGAQDARKALINSLDSIEGFSLEAAADAAKLTRVAYDVFVNPLVNTLSTVADDFLKATLNALITGRHWLDQINEDTSTLASLQTVLQSWVEQVSEMPKKVQNITATDLDGAQAYLRALHKKIQEEQAQLNAGATATPTSKSSSQTPTH